MKAKIIIGILVISSLMGFIEWRAYQDILTKPVVMEKTLLTINKGDSINSVLFKLKTQNHIEVDAIGFRILAYQKDASSKLKAGEYELAKDLTVAQILDILIAGKAHQNSITFPEGLNFKQILKKLQAHPDLKHTLQEMSSQEIMLKLKAQETHPEGLFFPDTYFFTQNASDFSILKMAYVKMQHVLKEEWQKKEIDGILKSPYEALILASIVEKETAVPSERPLIAGVFTHRLKIGMMLQTDPTVIYGMGDKYQGNIHREDLRTPTPYNTYVIKGLPPTPIAMPGKEAIHAALHPTPTDKLYFVAHGSNGRHVFSATLQEHNRAVQNYLQNSKK